jgi:hypothetical protein
MFFKSFYSNLLYSACRSLKSFSRISNICLHSSSFNIANSDARVLTDLASNKNIYLIYRFIKIKFYSPESATLGIRDMSII